MAKVPPKVTPPFWKSNPDADTALRKLYKRHADEFTESMTTTVKLQTLGGAQMVRVFSLRGCHLLGMLARTPVAKDFRRWALDVIENRDKERDRNLPKLYTAIADFMSESKAASIYGKGLNRWKGVKPEKQAAIDKLLEVIQPPLFATCD